MVVPVKAFRKVCSNQANPLRLITNRRVIMAETSGMTTNKITDSNRVSQGMAMPLTPSRRLTMGIKATRITRSLTATCTNV